MQIIHKYSILAYYFAQRYIKKKKHNYCPNSKHNCHVEAHFTKSNRTVDIGICPMNVYVDIYSTKANLSLVLKEKPKKTKAWSTAKALKPRALNMQVSVFQLFQQL